MTPNESNRNPIKRTVIITILGFAVGIIVGQNWKIERVAKSIDELEKSIRFQMIKIDKGGLSDPISTETKAPREQEDAVVRRAKEIAPFLDPVIDKQSIPNIARAVAEVDEWIFLPDDEKDKAAILTGYLDRLEEKILKKVELLDYKALAVDTGNEALDYFAKSSALMELMPMSKDESKMQKLQNILARRNVVKQQIDQIRHLRYNKWAVDQIEAGFINYHSKLNAIQKWTDDNALTESAIKSLAPINPNLLDAPAMELYLNLIRLTNEAVDEAHTIQLAKGLSDPSNIEKTELEF